MLKVYQYKGCGTCKKALKFLQDHEIDYREVAIRETPPTLAELKKMLGHLDGELRKLFNTSGQDYRALNLKEKMPTMTEAQALKLLSQNGNLVKRPFVLDKNWGTVGFKEDLWREQLL